jgi:hypothetical protein
MYMTSIEHIDLSCDVSASYSGSVYFESQSRQRLSCFSHSVEPYSGMGYVQFIPYRFQVIMRYQIKCKVILAHAWAVPEGSRSLRLPDFKTIGTLRCYA